MPDFSFCQRRKKIFSLDSKSSGNDYCLHVQLHAQVPKLSFPPRAHSMTQSLLRLWRIQNGHDVTIKMMSLRSPVSTQCHCDCCSLNSHCHAHKGHRKYTNIKAKQINCAAYVLINCAVCVLNGIINFDTFTIRGGINYFWTEWAKNWMHILGYNFSV